MGYYSEVAVAIKHDDWIKMQEEAVSSKAFEDKNDFLNFWDKMRERDDGIVILSCDWCKWYDDSRNVAFVMNFLKDVQHHYLRIGEEGGDIEEENTFENEEYYFWPQTSICFGQ